MLSQWKRRSRLQRKLPARILVPAGHTAGAVASSGVFVSDFLRVTLARPDVRSSHALTAFFNFSNHVCFALQSSQYLGLFERLNFVANGH